MGLAEDSACSSGQSLFHFDRLSFWRSLVHPGVKPPVFLVFDFRFPQFSLLFSPLRISMTFRRSALLAFVLASCVFDSQSLIRTHLRVWKFVENFSLEIRTSQVTNVTFCLACCDPLVSPHSWTVLRRRRASQKRRRIQDSKDCFTQ